MTRRPRSVVVVSAAADYRQGLAHGLVEHGWDVLEADSRAECARILATKRPSVVVVDVQATGNHAFLPDDVDAAVVTLATRPSPEQLRALGKRSRAVLAKPVGAAELASAVEAALLPAPRPVERGPFVPRAPAMRALLEEVERLRDADCPVLVLGETGTGKTVLARRIHAIGARPGGTFVDLNCAGLTSDFFESELFGHEKGAFTGAHAPKPGLLDVAHGGTLFLDEIGDIDLRVQPKILKVLEERKFRRMGDVRERAVDVRLIAATHHDLLQSVAARSFRADLYYRISTIKLVVPPLRERREDIVPLAREMLEKRGSMMELSVDAEERLTEHLWPGNIRELKNVIDSSSILSGGDVLRADDLRFDAVAAPPSERAIAVAMPAAPPSEPMLAADATRAEVERRHIELVLEAENGRVESAARRLGIPRSTLYWKLKRWGLTQAR